MCRIAGIISKTIPVNELAIKVKAMCQSLAHGGPDDEGVFQYTPAGLVFGHRRLTIIDLTPSGHQPMSDLQQRVWITFNGEIYNYPELRKELLILGALFKSESDTEVIIQAYLHWGIASFAKLRGMFAFALFDTAKLLTYLVRDTLGIKPLYYFAGNGNIIFASEVRAFKKAGFDIETDADWPIRFLAYGHIPEPYTTFKNVLSLPKGHFLCWNHNTCSYEARPYNLDNDLPETITNVEVAKTTVRTLLDVTVKRQLLADAPIGVFLSGGIDSSLLTLLAYRYKKNDLKTVSIFFDENTYNEKKYQNIIVKKTGAGNHQHLVKQAHFEAALPRIMADMDLPTTDGINSWFISDYARRDGLKAVLSGLGGDELFGGYPSFERIKYLKYLRIAPAWILNLTARLSSGRLKRVGWLAYKHPLADYFFLRGMFVPSDIAAILNIDKQRVLKVLFSIPLNLTHLTEADRAGWFETNLYMQNQLLRDTDVMSMAHGLEVRVPFLDEDFVQAINHISPDIRFNNHKPKKLLTDSFFALLPEAIWNRPKMGFSFPLQQWMINHKRITNIALYKSKTARRLIRKFGNNNLHWSKAFALYQLQAFDALTAAEPEKKVLLLTLQTFSATGGIQKMTRTLAYVLHQIAIKKNWKIHATIRI